MKEFKTEKGTILPIMDLKGKPYLQVAHRIVWFREEHADFAIETGVASSGEDGSPKGGWVVFKAILKDATGRVLSTAHKREAQIDFFDYIEKAETGAIGRALAFLGYGTASCGDDLNEGDRLADSPVKPVSRTQVPMPRPKITPVFTQHIADVKNKIQGTPTQMPISGINKPVKRYEDFNE